MLARAHTFTIEGLQTRRVTVEVDIRPGLPAFVIVGLADAAVREARERVRAAIRNCGYEFPSRRITANPAALDPTEKNSSGTLRLLATSSGRWARRLPPSAWRPARRC